MVKKIVIIGPESTGKSTLCSQLAAHYKTQWVPEYAREFLEANGRDYTFADLSAIAVGQIKSEEAITSQTTDHGPWTMDHGQPYPLFIDTDLYVIKVWSEFVFNKCDNKVLRQIAERKYDLYLLCNTDLPWEKDDLREYPDLETRQKLFNYYKDAMVNQYVPWVEISGGYEERFAQARRTVDELMG